MRTLGVIGGMGPAATFDFCSKLTAAAPALRDQDHPRILVDCDPSIPDRNAAIRGAGPSPGPKLAAIARGLVGQGAEVLAMPCNTAHAFREAIEEAEPGALVCIISATLSQVRRTGASRVGVLAAEGCLASGLYQDGLEAEGCAPLLLDGRSQEAFMELIYRIKSGELSEAVRAGMHELASGLALRGAEVIIAGCTEVPLALGGTPAGLPPVLSSTDALVRAVLLRLG